MPSTKYIALYTLSISRNLQENKDIWIHLQERHISASLLIGDHS